MVELFALQSVIIKKGVPKADALKKAQHIIGKKAFKASETKLTYRFRAIPKTKFISDSFRSKKVNKDITLVFAELKPEHSKLVGGGFMDYFNRAKDYVTNTFSSAKEAVSDKFQSAKDAVSDKIQSAKDAVGTYLAPREGYNNKTTAMLEQYGPQLITEISIYRKPVDAYIPVVLNLVSLGKWNSAVKKSGQDKFFHLSLIVRVGGELLNVEKLDVVSITKGTPTGDTVETHSVPLQGKEFTLDTMMQTARNAVGDTKFFLYDSFRNNCQSFVSYLLKGQGLYGPNEKEFTYQNIDDIVEEMPDYVKNFQVGLTDIAASFNKLSGQGEDKVYYRQPIYKGSGFLENYEADKRGAEIKDLIGRTTRRRFVGEGVEDFIKDKGLELASGFADSIGGENFLGQVQEDITDVFSGRRVGDTQRERADAQRLASQARDEEDRAWIKNNPIEADALQWAGNRQTNLQQELFGQWQTKFPSEDNPYSVKGYPYDAMNFTGVAQRKGFKTKAEVEKFYQKVKKDALQTLKKGSLAEAEKKYKEQEARDQKLMGRGVRGTPSGIAGGALSEEDQKRFKFLDNKEVLDLQTGKTFNPLDIAKKIDADITKRSDPAEFTKDLGKKMLSFYGIGSGNPFIDLGNKAVAQSGSGMFPPSPYGNLKDLERQLGRGMIQLFDKVRVGNGGMQPQPRRPASPLRLEQDMIRPANVIPEVSLVEVLERMQEQQPSLYEGVLDFICDDGCPITEMCEEPNLDGDGKPFSRGYNFMRALNASKAPKNSQKASIVAWREKNAENADAINQSKFRKFNYDKVPKVTRNLASRTDNDDPEGLHTLHDPQGIADGRNYQGIYDKKKGKKEKKAKKYLTLEDLDEDEYILSRNPSIDKKGEFAVIGNRNEVQWDVKGHIILPEPKKGYDSIKTLGDFDVKSSSDGDYIQQLYLTRKKKKEKKPKKAPQQKPEEKEAPKPTIEELARGHYEAEKGSKLRNDIVKDGEDRFGKKEFNTVLVRVRKRMQRERDLAQGIKRKFK